MPLNQEQLHRLIERYFNADTTVNEERVLLTELATTHLDSPVINEARAVMGFSLSHRSVHKPVAKRRPWLRAAASVAVLATIAVTGYRASLNSYTTAECFAYVDGERITDKSTVLSMMFEGLSNVADAAEESQEQALDSFENLVWAMEQIDSF